jgi:Tol biopolymer transport system component
MRAGAMTGRRAGGRVGRWAGGQAGSGRLALAVLVMTPALEIFAAGAQAPAKRSFSLDDLARIRTVSDPAISPDGAWVSYTVTIIDTKRDRRQSDVWMTSWDGSRSVRLTSTPEAEHGAQWSPDGRWLAFLSSRDDRHEVAQLWLLDRAGGEAERVTGYSGGVADYAWAPDGKRLALVVDDPNPDTVAADTGAAPADKRPVPIVLDRFQFKRDEDGYLDRRRKHLYLFDLASRRGEVLTPGNHDELLPSWAPDGRTIAFVTKRGPDPDRTDNWDLYTIDATLGAEARQLTTFEGSDGDPDLGSRPAWSPDGKSIAYLQGGPPRLIYYGVRRLAVAPAAGGPARVLSPTLDRWVNQPHWSEDGRSLVFLLEDDRTSIWRGSPQRAGRWSAS